MNEIERRDAGETMLRAFALDERDLEVRAAGERAMDFVCSTEDQDGHGTVIDQASWKLDRYRKNPVVFWNHRTSADIWSGGETSDEIPIARAENVRVEQAQLRAKIVFPPAGESELADEVWSAIASKRVNATSVGFRPGKVAKETVDGADRYRLFNCELFEISIVSIPSNPNCVAQRSLLAKLADPTTAATDRAAPTDAAPAADDTAPRASTETLTMNQFLQILAKKLGCTADEVAIIEALDKMPRALGTELVAGVVDETQIRALEKSLSDEVARRKAAEETEASLISKLSTAIASLGLDAKSHTDATEADISKAIATLTARAAKADELEPKVKELGDEVAKRDAADAEREVDFVVKRGKDYGFSYDERSRKALLAYRKADPKGFADDHKVALDGLRAFDDPKLFQPVTGENGKAAADVDASANRASDDADDFDARVRAYRAKNATASESEAIDAVLRNKDR